MIKYILASASPRRKELLAKLGISYEVIPSACEEVITQTAPEKVVEELSFQKAWDIAAQIQENRTGQTDSESSKETESTVVIGADTLVAAGGRILGKPADEAEAIQMLSLLSGQTHEVYTGVTVAVLTEEGKKSVTFHECTRVTFAQMSQAEIQDYVDTKEPMDKAGAYGIQGPCARFIQSIEGDYFNVVGLPVCRLYQTMKELKIIEQEG